jgi:hypothetical protein
MQYPSLIVVKATKTKKQLIVDAPFDGSPHVIRFKWSRLFRTFKWDGVFTPKPPLVYDRDVWEQCFGSIGKLEAVINTLVEQAQWILLDTSDQEKKYTTKFFIYRA